MTEEKLQGKRKVDKEKEKMEKEKMEEKKPSTYRRYLIDVKVHCKQFAFKRKIQNIGIVGGEKQIQNVAFY